MVYILKVNDILAYSVGYCYISILSKNLNIYLIKITLVKISKEMNELYQYFS